MKPYMRLETVDVFQLKDVSGLKNIVRLTNWLDPINEEFEYLESEYHRISSDPSRKCYIVYHQARIALFVNDVTNGAFEALTELED